MPRPASQQELESSIESHLSTAVQPVPDFEAQARVDAPTLAVASLRHKPRNTLYGDLWRSAHVQQLDHGPAKALGGRHARLREAYFGREQHTLLTKSVLGVVSES